MSHIIDKNIELIPKPSNLDSALGWIKGKLTFKRTPLPEVISVLERFYNVHIKIAHPDLKKKTITATIYQLTIDQAIASICETTQIKFTKKGKTYTLQNRKK